MPKAKGNGTHTEVDHLPNINPGPSGLTNIIHEPKRGTYSSLFPPIYECNINYESALRVDPEIYGPVLRETHYHQQRVRV